MQPVVLGSTSPYRRALLEKLGVPFTTAAPSIDETAMPDESAERLVRRLAEDKARAVGRRFPSALVIGSDQVAVLEQRIIGKPRDKADAVRQLRAASGRTVRFLTGLCLFNAATGRTQVTLEPFAVRFRSLDDGQIARYLKHEAPFDCAGSFKSEGFGITLFRSLEGRDPNALIGLPLIALVEMLAEEGVELP